MTFVPSIYSRINPTEEMFSPAGESSGSASSSGFDASALVSAIGTIGAASISTIGAATAARADRKHQERMTKKQGKLATLQERAAAAQAAADRSAAGLAWANTARIVLIAGGVVTAAGLIYTAVKNRRQETDEEEEES